MALTLAQVGVSSEAGYSPESREKWRIFRSEDQAQLALQMKPPRRHDTILGYDAVPLERGGESQNITFNTVECFGPR